MVESDRVGDAVTRLIDVAALRLWYRAMVYFLLANLLACCGLTTELLAGEVTLSVSAGGGEYQVFGTINETTSVESPLGSPIIGIAAYVLKVTADGLAITSSVNESPLDGANGFSLFRSDFNGI